MRQYGLTIGGRVPSETAIARALRGARFAPFPRASDRRAWAGITRRSWIKPGVPRLIEAAAQVAATPPPLLRATDYLAFQREGTRTPYRRAAPPRRSRLATLCAAECFEHAGRFLDALLDESWLIAEETSWVMSAHVPRGDGPLPDVENPCIDLAVAMTGRQLAETLYVLGGEMDAHAPQWRRRINYELRRRVIEPYLKGGFWWETTTNNWNAVCNCGVAASVLMGDFDTRTRARVLHKALDEIRTFLSGFTSDGGCTEGPGYWRYGVSWFAALAYYVDQATGGRVDLLADPIVPRVFEYPTKMVLTGTQVVPFADCALNVGFTSGPVVWAARKANVGAMVDLASRRDVSSGTDTDLLNIMLSGRPRQFRPPRDAWLPELQVMTARGSGMEGEQLVLAAKGGHNGETHNHNDVGNFLVHWRGESLVCELGVGEYIRQMFSPTRYELLTTRSLGHNVPLVNGTEQRAGSRYRARAVSRRLDQGGVTLSMDIAGAYPAQAGLKSLVRTLTLHRDAGEWVELVDAIRFAVSQGQYELPLYTVGKFRHAGRKAVRAVGEQGSLKVEFSPDVLDARLERVKHSDTRLEASFGPVLHRCVFRLRRPAQEATVRLRFVPT